MTKEEIIKETVNEYQDASKRAKDGNICKYEAENGNKCAVGRCMIPGSLIKRSDLEIEGVAMISDFVGPVGPKWNLEEILKPEYRGHEWAFWRDLQILHDEGIFYTDGKMNDRGQEFAARLIERWK